MFVGLHEESVDRGRVAHDVVEQVVADQRVCFVRRDHVLGADRNKVEEEEAGIHIGIEERILAAHVTQAVLVIVLEPAVQASPVYKHILG